MYSRNTQTQILYTLRVVTFQAYYIFTHSMFHFINREWNFLF